MVKLWHCFITLYLPFLLANKVHQSLRTNVSKLKYFNHFFCNIIWVWEYIFYSNLIDLALVLWSHCQTLKLLWVVKAWFNTCHSNLFILQLLTEALELICVRCLQKGVNTQLLLDYLNHLCIGQVNIIFKQIGIKVKWCLNKNTNPVFEVFYPILLLFSLFDFAFLLALLALFKHIGLIINSCLHPNLLFLEKSYQSATILLFIQECVKKQSLRA